MKLPKELQKGKQQKNKSKPIRTRFDYKNINVIEKLAGIKEELDEAASKKTIKQLIGEKGSKMAFAMLVTSVMDCKISAENKKGFVELNNLFNWLDKIDDIIKLGSRESMLEYYMDLDESEKTILESIYERLIFDFGKESELKESVKNYFSSIHQRAKELRRKT